LVGFQTMQIIDQKNIHQIFKNFNSLWPFTFYSDPALAYCVSLYAYH
jgi:hypothetical protein